MNTNARMNQLRVAEFFAGIGLVRAALGRRFKVVFANDIDPKKFALYKKNFGASDFLLRDIADVHASDVPDVDVATASFPCTDVSLAGNRRGLDGEQSGMFWHFARIISEMEDRKPQTVLLENVPGLATSNDGRDLVSTVATLNDLGYTCDMLVGDARWFVPQSRQRLFIIGTRRLLDGDSVGDWQPSAIRPEWMRAFAEANDHLNLRPLNVGLPPHKLATLADIVDRPHSRSGIWWDEQRVDAFVGSLSNVNQTRLEQMKQQRRLTWATAYRRTRNGRPVWEIRSDAIAGCLRTTRGGSSKQAVVEAGRGKVRVRWMSAREYAKLQGAPKFKIPEGKESEAMFAFGDAVCVPVVRWIVEECLLPHFHSSIAADAAVR